MTVTFDPQQYKTTTRAQWEDAAEAWHRWGPVIEDWLGAATERMLDAAGITAGSRVLDVAAGAGGQSLAAARRVGPTGHVLATDISPAILEYAAKAASDAGLAQRHHPRARRRTPRRRGGQLRRGHLPGRVDLLPGPAGRAGRHAPRAAAGRPHLRGRLFDRGAQRVLRHPGRHHPPPRPTAAAGAGAARSVQPRRPWRRRARPRRRPGSATSTVESVPSPLRMASAAECVAFERDSFGALHQMLAGLPAPDREAAWAEIGRALAEFEGPDGFVGPCEMLVISATR